MSTVLSSALVELCTCWRYLWLSGLPSWLQGGALESVRNQLSSLQTLISRSGITGTIDHSTMSSDPVPSTESHSLHLSQNYRNTGLSLISAIHAYIHHMLCSTPTMIPSWITLHFPCLQCQSTVKLK